MKRPSPRRISLGMALALVALAALVMALTVAPYRDRRDRELCRQNLQRIGQALHAYHADHGSFPPAYTVDPAGKPLLSWRVTILPYTDARALRPLFRDDEPWDGPHNRALVGRMPSIYACPAHDAAAARGETPYKVPVGVHTLFPGPRSAKLSDVPCALHHPLLVTEVLNGEVPWSAPSDVEVDAFPEDELDDHRLSLTYPARGGAVGRHHAAKATTFRDGAVLSEFGANTVSADGRVRYDELGLRQIILEDHSNVKTIISPADY